MKLYAMIAADAGTEILVALSGRIPLAGVITTQAFSGRIRGHADGMTITDVDSYDLSSPEDRQSLLELEMDVLLVLGWQRLIPDWLIDHCAIGAVGIHGSSHGITRGRGRSPQNWALLLGKPSFTFSLFWITPGVDDGPVIASLQFPLTDRDDIVSSQMKVAQLSAELVVEALAAGHLDAAKGVPQSGDVAYLPQRLPEDGYVDWAGSTALIDRQVRALTRPYPGALATRTDGSMIMIWRGRPMDYGTSLRLPPPGTVMQVSVHGGFVVATGDGAYLVDDWSSDSNTAAIALGEHLEGVAWRVTLDRILSRHRTRWPNSRVAPFVVEFDPGARSSAGD